MLKFLASSKAYLLFSYFLISCLPFLSYFLGKGVEHSMRLLSYELVAWLILWSVFKSPRWFHYLLIPAFLVIPIEIYLRIYFGQGISTHHLGIITETSPKEAIEFLGNKVWLLLLVIAITIAWWWSLLVSARKTKELDWQHPSRWFCMATISCLFIVWSYGARVGVASASEKDASQTQVAERRFWQLRSWEELQTYLDQQPALPNWLESAYDLESFSRSWPLGIWARLGDFYQERRYLTSLNEKSRQFRFHAQQAAGNDFQQTIVVVIGESSRFDRWSLNGYERLTTPNLDQENNLVSFSDMITAVAATRLSVPIITTRKPATQSLKPGFTEKSFLSAYKEAGFKTFWISNQMSFGQFDTPTSVIAKEADVTQFLNLGGFTNNSSYDEVLLAPMQTALQDSAPNKLIVIHSLGNHWNYSHRYPQNFDKWKPSLFGIAKPAYTNLKNKEALNNSYDNSILYNDWILSRMIGQLKAIPHMTALWYISDHGQTLYDGSCNLAFHGHNTKYEFHIPAFVWYSDQYAAQHPDKIQHLKAHQHAKLSTENVFHSIVDMVDIRYPDEKLERSVFSPIWTYHTRYVDSYGWTHYDDAYLKGDCREVIDNKQPLKQEK
ncbi:phosphoethanolamine transferase [Undibacterium baiyunense]|uniref:Phosphoethanolamine transferase n=1 Tax=Undibacterium baiyunense TaxID=2828731 RepID=A0A941DIX1_9BURK|nr:phosphoethanolamine transferase [Undibacterium baiyunense]MBR7748425.1 phosphoethanolamine transferase [Undibacterium baiyunense]